ncbi:MAG: right-handed parallel beta-helix repeat-containing protein [Terriglobia bacterium]
MHAFALLCCLITTAAIPASGCGKTAARRPQHEIAPEIENARNIRLAIQFPGADLGAQINAASVALGAGHGEIWVTTKGVVRTAIKLLSGQTLRLFAPTTWQSGATLSSGDSVVGDGESSAMTVSFLKPAAVLNGDAVMDIRVSNLDATAPDGSVGYLLVGVTASNYVMVSDCTVRNVRLFAAGSSAKSYAAVDDGNSSHDVTVVNNTAISKVTSHDSGAAISLAYTWRAVVSGNITEGFDAGVQWWGGDANYNRDGGPGNKRKTGDITISHNATYRSGGAGIWGSMGDGITVTGNVIRNCGDICLDTEGSNHVIFSGNVVQDGRNGAIGTFFYNSDVTITGNSVVSTSAKFPLLSIYNSSQSSAYNQDLLITGNHFACVGQGICRVSTAMGPAQREIFTGNVLRDVKLEFTGNNQHYIEISHNDFVFDRSSPLPFNAIDVEHTNSLNGEPGMAKILDNMIDSQAVQPQGSAAVFVVQDDYNAGAVSWIERNELEGSHPFPTDIAVRACSSNPHVISHFLIEQNILGTGVVKRAGGPRCKPAAMVLQGNRLRNNQPLQVQTAK